MMRKYIERWIIHKCAYLITEYKLTGRISFSGLMHDWEKPILMILLRDRKKVHTIHRSLSSHHEQNGKIKDIKAAIIDWECSRMTKPESPMNARETFMAYYQHIGEIEQHLKDFGL